MPCALTVRQRHDWGKRRWHLHMCITEAIRSHCRVTAHTRIIVVARATEQPASKRRATTRRLPPIQALDYHTGNSDRHGCRCTRHKLRAATLRRRWSCFADRPRLSLRDGRPAGRRRRELLQRRRRNVCGRAEAQLHAAHLCLVPQARAAVALSHQQSTELERRPTNVAQLRRTAWMRGQRGHKRCDSVQLDCRTRADFSITRLARVSKKTATKPET